jgi:UDP-N-acetylmuramoylalanine--D-glutamate ligase
MNLKGKKVTIVGAARSGIAAANLALEQGACVRITDAKPLADLEKSLNGLKDRSKVLVESGAHTRAFIQDSDLVVASPAVWKDAEPLQWAREKGIAIMGEIEFSWRFCRVPVIAVTGSNGKTTTVNLITEILKSAGKKVVLCGNVGIPFAQHVLTPGVDYFVVEISSFQLELCTTFRPHIALLTNFSPNHLDRHPDMQDYFEAKKRLFMNQTPSDFAILNASDPWSIKIEGQISSQVVFFNQPGQSRNPNHLAVLEAVRILGIADEVAEKVFAAFPGVEHRMERVRVLDGVEYINDSKATTAESGTWALTNLPGPIIMICGGSDKGLDYSHLRDLVKKKVKKMLVMTRTETVRRKLHEAFDGIVPLEDHTDMGEVLHSARAQAVSGDKVLLSPMTASFDMFTSYEHRGKVFKQLVNELR